ncbi:MAG: type II methionyl aminopeptidase [Nanoarchaeota archaeon]|nr:type II methionyl aminopeptidase [Nanoarchaeota archaeon]
MNTEKIIKAGKIASEVRAYAKKIVEKGMPLLEIAENIEGKIVELGGKPAFPVNLSINNIAAHYTPEHDDKTLAHGLLKVDFGVHVNGWIADTAFSVDLENSEENKKLIEASEKALDSALTLIKNGVSTSEIGESISKKIESLGFSPVMNLSGHEMDEYELHTGISIPNVNDGKSIEIKSGLYAVEPFATNGSGRVKDGRPSGIYELISNRNVRNSIAREILEFIEKEYYNLPFCSRWIIKKFGTKAIFGLRQLEESGNLHQFNQLIEISGSKVSQAEHTILVEKKDVKIVTA